jgi:hypothetical protein
VAQSASNSVFIQKSLQERESQKQRQLSEMKVAELRRKTKQRRQREINRDFRFSQQRQLKQEKERSVDEEPVKRSTQSFFESYEKDFKRKIVKSNQKVKGLRLGIPLDWQQDMDTSCVSLPFLQHERDKFD